MYRRIVGEASLAGRATRSSAAEALLVVAGKGCELEQDFLFARSMEYRRWRRSGADALARFAGGGSHRFASCATTPVAG